ncbi:MAG: hypothetical protein HY043_17940 [Verrucomicrobia bacterium]|nr:hypothetical protein [Verrucomicrobiota bacterium]
MHSQFTALKKPTFHRRRDLGLACALFRAGMSKPTTAVCAAAKPMVRVSFMMFFSGNVDRKLNERPDSCKRKSEQNMSRTPKLSAFREFRAFEPCATTSKNHLRLFTRQKIFENKIKKLPDASVYIPDELECGLPPLAELAKLARFESGRSSVRRWRRHWIAENYVERCR